MRRRGSLGAPEATAALWAWPRPKAPRIPPTARRQGVLVSGARRPHPRLRWRPTRYVLWCSPRKPLLCSPKLRPRQPTIGLPLLKPVLLFCFVFFIVEVGVRRCSRQLLNYLCSLCYTILESLLNWILSPQVGCSLSGH